MIDNNKTGIYKFTFSNGHYYIGQSYNIKRRSKQHIKEMSKGTHTNPRVQNCYNKYGEPNFEILVECTKDCLDVKESEYLFKHIGEESCCNMCKEGKSRLGIKHTQKSKDKIRDYQHLIGITKSVYMFSRDDNFMICKFKSIADAATFLKCSPKDVQKSCKTNSNVQKYKFKFATQVDTFLNTIKDLVPL
jgi:hypothetical protein